MEMQSLANALLTSSAILLIAVAFQLVLSANGYFHFAQAGFFALAPYLVLLLRREALVPLTWGIPLAVIATTTLSIALQHVLFRPLHARNASPTSLLIVSLGVLIVIQSAIALVFGNATSTIRSAAIGRLWHVAEAQLTTAQIAQILVSWTLFGVVLFSSTQSRWGRELRAISDDRALAMAIGIRVDSVALSAVAVSGGLSAIAGILSAMDVDMVPSMGFLPLMLGVVAVVIGGGSLLGTAAGALLIGGLQHVFARWIDASWQNAVVFGLLILLLRVRPNGLSGVHPPETTL